MRGIGRYKASKVQTADRKQIVLMLYQEAVHKLTLASQKMGSDSTSTWLPLLHTTRAIYLELDGALDHKVAPELCGRLHQLYIWCMKELIAAGRDHDPKHLHDVIKVTVTLLEGWKTALEATATKAA